MLFPIQVVSIAVTALVYDLMPPTAWFLVLFSFGFSHYLVSLCYSRRQVQQVLLQPYSYLPMLLVSAAGAILYLNAFPLMIFFAIHHVFNETYLKLRIVPGLNKMARQSRLTLMLTGFHTFAYFALVIPSFAPGLTTGVFMVMTLVCFALYLVELWKGGEMKSLHHWVGAIGGESIMIALLPVALLTVIRWELIVFYHIMLWGLLPLYRLIQGREGKAILGYLGLTFGSLALFVALTPLGPASLTVSMHQYYQWFVLWSYFHITTSFFLSRAHPQWINQWFAPRTEVVRA